MYVKRIVLSTLILSGLVGCGAVREPRSPAAGLDVPGDAVVASTTHVTSAIVAAAPDADAKTPRDVATPRAHVSRTPHDTNLEEQVRRALHDAHLDGPGVRVAAAPGGLVVLSGGEASPTTRQRALDAALHVPGVTAVVDRFGASDDATTPTTAPHAVRLVETIASILAWDPRLDGGRIHAQADEQSGVRLTGVVSSASEAKAAEDDAYQAGARAVVNEIEVTGTPTRR